MRNKIHFNEPYLTGNELSLIKDVFKENIFHGMGRYTKNCEQFISKILRSKNVLLTDSCTSSLDISALLIKESDNDEVILPSYTFTSTASAFLKAGFKLIFADIDPFTAMLDLKDIERKITKKTKAIVTVHYGGLSSNVIEIQKLCKRKRIFLVEDAAQAFNCFINNKALGTFGDFGCFSFHETKNLHAGLSGALYIKNKKNLKRASYIRERGTNRSEVIAGNKRKYSWVDIGGSYYPTEIQSAFLFSQLQSLKKNNSYRKKLFEYYEKNLISLCKNKYLHFNLNHKNHKTNYHAFYIILSQTKNRERLRKHLLKKRINAFIGYIPLHSSKMGKLLGYKKTDLPVTEKVAKKILRLPLHNNMKIIDVKRVCNEINNFFID